MNGLLTILEGDWNDRLRELPDGSVNTTVTSPPYWGLRDYGVAGQLGLEKTPEEYVERLVLGFREVRRVLGDEGTIWVNLGDSYAGGGRGWKSCDPNGKQLTNGGVIGVEPSEIPSGLKPKDLVGIPWRVAFALQADGWFLRSDIIWHKPNPMPESVTDRPTKAHEYIFLLSKSARYFYDAEAIKEPLAYPEETRRPVGSKGAWQLDGREQRENGGGSGYDGYPTTRNKRSVWTVTTRPYSEAHFATFPSDLIKPCILAGCPVGGTVLDPFGGSGTTGMVALEYGRKAILIELNPEYCRMIRQRCDVTPGLPL